MHSQLDNSVYDGIPELLKALLGAGRTQAVATSKPEVFATSIVARFDLDRYCSAVVGGESDGRRSRKADIHQPQPGCPRCDDGPGAPLISPNSGEASR